MIVARHLLRIVLMPVVTAIVYGHEMATFIRSKARR